MKTPNRWVLLAVVVSVQALGTWLANAPIFLVAHLHLEHGLSLARAGLLASTSLMGGTLTLIGWGVLVDRIGERRSLASGLLLGAVAGLGSTASPATAWIAATWFLIGVGTASLNSASGRLIVGWFPSEQRGTAMGIRQTALPLGVGLAAFFEPVLADRYGLAVALLVPSVVALIAFAAVGLFVIDPPRPELEPSGAGGGTRNPYRNDRRLVRIHLASALLVVPQITVWTFIVVWLIDARGWSAPAAGGLAAATQLLGAAGRVGAGWWSDQVGSRLRSIRVIAVGATLTMLVLALTESTSAAVVLMVVATVVTVADNGLAFTSVAELGGPFWAGRAMGIQNTGQYLTAAAVPPAVGALIADRGYAVAFAIVAIFPLMAIAVVPLKEERPSRNQGEP
ncbi:MAG TPA: MFS transporter [Aeromicrobium sp.]|nr:MFS transporter [Aeromicrobium sp.]